MSIRRLWTRYGLVLAVVCAGATLSAGQMKYWSGQNVVPVFEGWERNSDGSFNMVVGYDNRNYEEELDIPIGPDNNIEPGGPDQGQPTHFEPARHMYVFRIRVPKDFDPKKRIVWTLTIRGKTEKANLFLLPEWETDIGVFLQNGPGGGPGASRSRDSKPPTAIPGPAQTIKLGETATLTASVTSGAAPSPEAQAAAPAGRGRGGAPRGPQLRVDWMHYRGPAGGKVTFTPRNSPVVDSKATTKASFSLPGQYVLRGFGTEGALTAPADVTVTVTAASSAVGR